MASARPPRPSSGARNPFDSSDDENDAPVAAPSSSSYHNPFDGEEADGTAIKNIRANVSRPSPASSIPLSQADVKNPFDDYDDEEGEEPNTYRYPQGGFTDKAGQDTLFDEEPTFHGDNGMQERQSTRKSSAASALKKVRKLKDAGAAQASRIVDGGVHHAHRFKEGSVRAFNSTDGKENLSEQGKNNSSSKHTKDVHDRRATNPNRSAYARSQLLAEEARSGDLGGGGSGSFETANRTRYDDHDFQGSEIEQRNMQELEGYAVQKSEDTTKTVQNCLKVAEDMKGDATHTLLNLHQQGEQLRRTHDVAYEIDRNLTSGENVLGNLGGMFSRTWKPHGNSAIKGPVDDPKEFELRRKGHHLQQRTALGLGSKAQKDQPSHHVYDSQAQTTEEKVELEKRKQDDGLSDLSNVLDHLKDMTVDMGAEISRQNNAMDTFDDDLGILGERVKVANVRGRHLLKK